MDVAQATFATFGKQHALSKRGQIVQQITRLGVENHGADRHFQGDVVTALAIAVGATAALTVLREVLFGEAVVNQGIEIFIRNRVHAAATPPVTTVRPAVGFVFFAAKARHAVATIAGDDFDFCFVYKFHDSFLARFSRAILFARHYKRCGAFAPNFAAESSQKFYNIALICLDLYEYS